MSLKKHDLQASLLMCLLLASWQMACGNGSTSASSASEGGLCTESRTLATEQCPNYSELTSDSTPGVVDRSSSILITREETLCGETATRTYEWEFLYTPSAGVVEQGTPEEITDFYDQLGPEESFSPIAFTNSQFEYFQCMYAYSRGYTFALNLKRDAMPPKQEEIGFSVSECPPVDLIKTKCAEEDGSASIARVDLGRFSFEFEGLNSDTNDFGPQSGEIWRTFCDQTIAASDGPSANLAKTSATDSQAFCTYSWGEFAWTHGFTTEFTTPNSR